MNTVKVLISTLFLAFALQLGARVKMPAYFSDGMVLQQNSVVSFHGTASPGERVVVSPGWTSQRYTATASSRGAWSVAVATPSYGGPHTITVSDGTPITIKNVLIGEVWICSGQSNMEMPVKGFRGQPVAGSADLIAGANPNQWIRLLRQPNAWSSSPKDNLTDVKWTSADSRAVADFSAVGYVFGKTLSDALEVPVGLIQCAWSMSTIQAWMPRETLRSQFRNVELPDVNSVDFGWTQGTPTLLWNAMVAPWKGFPVAGVIWYQGEANTPNAAQYKALFPAMVNDWRTLFNNPNLPFYYAQLAPWRDEACDKTLWADFRQVQNELLSEVPNTGIVTTGDLGDSIFIHFPKKIEVGRRFAYLALEKKYGRSGLRSAAPMAVKCEAISETELVVEMSGGEDGLTPENAMLKGFEVVDANGKVHPAKATILNGDCKVKVWNDDVAYPVEVRYGYHNYYESSLYSNIGIPAAPFRIAAPKCRKTALMWIDAEANYRRFCNADSIDYYMKKIASLGFTHAVVDVRPISGYVLYNSRLAPKVKGAPTHFDYLAKFIETGHKYGLKVLASMNVFCAGHNYHNDGVIYTQHPEWASVVYDPKRGLISITEQKHKYGAMVNPVNPQYQRYIVDIMKELAGNYPQLDGLMLDRVRYDGLQADFSEMSRKAFEEYIGKKVKKFPQDILTWQKRGNRHFKAVPGSLYNKWLEWRAKIITDFMAFARGEVKSVRPDIVFGTYTGAWYPSYYEVGANFASRDYDPSKDFDWATPLYKNFGYAELIDLYATGNYYTDITLKDYKGSEVWNETDSEAHSGTWYCVEGSCRHLRQILGTNRFLGGLLVDQFYKNPQDLSRSIAQNLKDSDGLMIFDIVHIINKNLWKEVEEGMKEGGNL